MATKRSKSSELYFTRYQNSKLAQANRLKKLQRQLKLQPKNAEQINKAIKNVVGYRRGTPKSPVWSHTDITKAVLVKRFLGKFDKNIFSNDIEVQTAAARVRKQVWFDDLKIKDPKFKSMFCLANRAHDGRGNLLWAQ